MKKISTLGIDLAKIKIRVVGMNAAGKVVLRKWVCREEFLRFMGNLEPCLVGMEACAGSNYWAREIKKLGHEVKLMPSQYVRPYVKTNKNDDNDAEGCAEAVTRPTMRFAGIKSESQQVLGQLHRARERLIGARTALGNEIRGFLGEFGIVVPKGIEKLRNNVFDAVQRHAARFAATTCEMLTRLCDELKLLNEEIEYYEKKLVLEHKASEKSQLLDKIPGLGEITSTALVATFSGVEQFKNGRHFAAFLGLVPAQHSTGGKARLGRISKRGDTYIRKLLVQGANAVLKNAGKKKDRYHRWAAAVHKRCGWCKAAVAIANKNARIAWVAMARGTNFDAGYIPAKAKGAIATTCAVA
jgi:transposase